MTTFTANGNSYSDDGSSARDMRNDGHRSWLLPMLSDAITDLEQKQTATVSSNGVLAIRYNFSTTTADADPTAGLLRLDNATQNLSTTIRIDLLDMLGVDWAGVIDSFDDSTSTVKGQIRIAKVADGSKWINFNLTAKDSSSGYRNLTVTVIDSSDTNPFTNNDPLILSFTRTGDRGDDAEATAASQAQMEAATDNTVFATPANVNWHPGTAKFWIRCNNAGAIAASHNITSITDSGTGVVLVTIAQDFSGANYAILATCEDTKFAAIKSGGGAPAAGTFQLGTYDIVGSPADVGYMFAVGFGDQ